MIILNIETSTDACSAAVTENGQLLTNEEGQALAFLSPEKSEHARELAVMAEDLVACTHAMGKKVQAVAVSAGPGSYTGLRIGASTAKGIAYGLQVPLVAIPTLQIMAASAISHGASGLLCPMIDARRMEVYNAFYRSDLSELAHAQATIIDEQSFLCYLEQQTVCFFGNGAAKCQSVITHPNAVFLPDILPDAAYMGALAEQALAAHQEVDVAYWTPFYLKEFEAKVSSVKGLH